MMTGASMQSFVVILCLFGCSILHASTEQDQTPVVTCGVCMELLSQKWNTPENYDEMCNYFEACELFDPNVEPIDDDLRNTCEWSGYCPEAGSELWEKYVNTSNLNIRISKAYGAREGANLRVSVVSDKKLQDPVFDYTEQFKYRWTQFYLNTGLIEVSPGETSTLTVAGQDISVYVPKDNEGTRGVIFADPCFTSHWVHCKYGAIFDVFNRSTLMLNAINAHSDVQYWMVVGDNFYDQIGSHTDAWFKALTLESKSKIFGSVPGNHDYWVHGTPHLYKHFKDQLGNGFMQYYGQDVTASYTSKSATPYDFSADPRHIFNDGKGKYLAKFSNFFFYNTIGNVGFIGFSGAYNYETTGKVYFEEACEYFAGRDDAKVVLLLGHWHKPDRGSPDMSTPEVYANLMSLDACKPVASRLRYVEGHQHCNQVMEADVGFMVGGNGMPDKSDCSGEFGFPIFDSTGATFNVYYFPFQSLGINNSSAFDNFDAIYECVRQNGISGCYHMARLWSSTNL